MVIYTEMFTLALNSGEWAMRKKVKAQVRNRRRVRYEAPKNSRPVHPSTTVLVS